MGFETFVSTVNAKVSAMDTFHIVCNIFIVYFALRWGMRFLKSVYYWFVPLANPKTNNPNLVYDVNDNVVLGADGRPMIRHSMEHKRYSDKVQREAAEFFEDYNRRKRLREEGYL